MTEKGTIRVVVPAVDARLDLSAVRQFGTGRDGTLIAIGYVHEEYFPNLSGPVLHFQLPAGRVVLTWPNPDGYHLIWRENHQHAQVDEGAAEVCT